MISETSYPNINYVVCFLNRAIHKYEYFRIVSEPRCPYCETTGCTMISELGYSDAKSLALVCEPSYPETIAFAMISEPRYPDTTFYDGFWIQLSKNQNVVYHDFCNPLRKHVLFTLISKASYPEATAFTMTSEPHYSESCIVNEICETGYRET